MDFQAFNDKIIAILKEKVVLPCACCGHKDRTLIPGFMMQALQQKPEGLVIGGPSVPMVGSACTNCGHVQTFALKILLPEVFNDGTK